MAQAFSKQPTTPAISFSDNPIVFEWYEDTAFFAGTTSDYYFEVKIYVDSVLQKTARREVEHTNGGRAYARIDISEIMRLTISAAQYTTTFQTQLPAPQVYVTFEAKYKVSGVDTNGALVTSSTIRVIKGSLTKLDFINYRDNDLFLTSKWGAFDGWQFFTQFPRSEKYYVGMDEDVFLNVVFRGDFTTTTFKLYDVTGTLITSGTSGLIDAVDNALYNVSPQTAIDRTTITASDFDDCYYYTVQIQEDSFDTLSEVFTFYIDRECERYPHARLYFLGKSGNIEAYTFKMKSMVERSTEVRGKRGYWGEWQNGTFVQDTLQTEETTHLVESSGEIMLQTDWINAPVQNWLSENLYESPYVLMERDGVLQRVIVQPIRYEKKQDYSGEQFNLEIKVKLSLHNQSQLI
jgi:hypothetical protein